MVLNGQRIMKVEWFILLCGCLILSLGGCSCKMSDRQKKMLPVGAVDNTVGINDTLGISLHPESSVYSIRQKQIVFVLSNQSGMDVSYGLDYRYTYEDETGIWREVSKRPVVFEVEYVLRHGDKQYIYADLYRNLPGQYRFFFDVWQYDRNYTFMTEFCLSEGKVSDK